MMTRDAILELLEQQYPYLATHYGVKQIGLFGSYAKDMPTETSDIDLVIAFEHPIGLRFIELQEYLEELLGKSIDLLTPAGIQSIRVPHIAQHIEESVVYVQTS